MNREMIEAAVKSSIIDLVYDYFAYDVWRTKQEAEEEADKVIDTMCKKVSDRLLAIDNHYVTVVIQDNRIEEVYYADNIDDASKWWEALEVDIENWNREEADWPSQDKNLMMLHNKEERFDNIGWNTMWELE
jgi:allantoicase